MCRGLAFLAALFAFVALAACGLEIVGSMTAVPPVAESGAADPLDSGTVNDVVTSDVEALPDEILDGGGEEPVGDAGILMTDCGAAVIADNFTNAIGPGWTLTGDAVHGQSLGNGFVRLTRTGAKSQRSGLFFVPTVIASSFRASFRYYAERPDKDRFDDPYYGDGLTFVWLTSGDIGGLDGGTSGQSLGVPRTMGGGAFALDSYDNFGIGDPPPPSFSLLRVEPPRGVPGSYDWHVKNRGPYSNLYERWREVSITYENGMLSASVSNSNLFTREPIPASNIVAIGFTAATGGVDAVGYFVDTARIELTSPTCPP